MLDLIADAAFDTTGSGSLRPVSKADVFGEFMWPLDPEDFPDDEPLPAKHEASEQSRATGGEAGGAKGGTEGNAG